MKYKHSHTYYDLKATYKCDLCNNELTSRRSFEKHMKMKHSCDRKLTYVTMNQQNETSLRHMKSKHSTDKYKYDLCENESIRRNIL